jgi:hypothetical protein
MTPAEFLSFCFPRRVCATTGLTYLQKGQLMFARNPFLEQTRFSTEPSRVAFFSFQAFSVDDAQKIKYERNDDDGAKYTQATTHAPSRMTVIASTDAEEQQQNYNYQQHDLHLGLDHTAN